MNIEKLTSRDNPKLKLARAVRDGKERESIFIEGVRLCSEAVASGIEIEAVFVTHRLMESGVFADTFVDRQTIYMLSEQTFASLADTNSPQGIVMIAKRPAFHSGPADVIGTAIFLYQINNPSNLGAVIRTAEAAGVDRIFLSAGSADPYSPKSLRAAMGSAFRTRISEGCILETMIDRAKSNGTEVLAVDAKGKSIYTDFPKKGSQMFVFGSEAHGLPDKCLAQADSVVSIPMNPKVESLNLAVSCGIILFEARRRSITEWQN